MGEDRSIPDHVNDGVPRDEVDRFDRYEVMLYVLAGRHTPPYAPGDDVALADASCFAGEGEFTRMKRNALINAAINNNKVVNKKLAKAYPGVKNFQGLIDRLRLEVIMRRLDGQ